MLSAVSDFHQAMTFLASTESSVQKHNKIEQIDSFKHQEAPVSFGFKSKFWDVTKQKPKKPRFAEDWSSADFKFLDGNKLGYLDSEIIMEMDATCSAIDALCGDIGRAKSLSHESSVQSDEFKMGLVYGEMDTREFLNILEMAHQGRGEGESLSIADLGCGRGKLLLAAKHYGRFIGELIGVELVPELLEEARNLEAKLETQDARRNVNWICGDILENVESWKHVDVVTMCCTCFEEDLIMKIGRLCQKHLKIGAFVVTTSHPLRESVKMGNRPLNGFKLVLQKKDAKMSWGPATVYIYQKVSANKVQNAFVKHLFRWKMPHLVPND
jgi:SAM-dependent methyltransferase